MGLDKLAGLVEAVLGAQTGFDQQCDVSKPRGLRLKQTIVFVAPGSECWSRRPLWRVNSGCCYLTQPPNRYAGSSSVLTMMK